MFLNKKIILFLVFCLLVFGVVHFVQAEHFERSIGKERISSCDCSPEGDGWVCSKCTCQDSNDVDDCHVGWLINDPVCACCGDCTLNNFIGLAVNIADKLLQLLGVFALLFLIMGGIIWMTSGGSAEKVKKGKDVIKGAIIGLIIVLIAFTIVRMVMEALGPEAEKYLPGEKCTIDAKDDAICIDVGIEKYNQYKKDGTGPEDYICRFNRCKGESTICCKKKKK